MLRDRAQRVKRLLALLEVPVPRGEQVHVRVQKSGVAVHSVRGRRVPVDGHLHVGQIILQAAVARVDLKGVPVVPAGRRRGG